jgi:ABC-type proline/glycine betaine transport system permease subunit
VGGFWRTPWFCLYISRATLKQPVKLFVRAAFHPLLVYTQAIASTAVISALTYTMQHLSSALLALCLGLLVCTASAWKTGRGTAAMLQYTAAISQSTSGPPG